LATFTTPNGAQRQFCRTCGSSLTFRGKNQATLEFSLATLEDTTSISTMRLQPDAHVFYNSKVPWIESLCTAGGDTDNLLKYSRGRESERVVVQESSAGRIFGDAGERITEARVKEMIASAFQELNVVGDLEKRLDAKIESLAQTMAGNGSLPTMLRRQSDTQPSPTSEIVLRGTNNLGGVLTRLPSDYQFPRCSTYDCWVQWNIGNSERQIPPLRTLFPKEFQFIDNKPKTASEKKGQRGPFKTNRRPARKIYADMKFVCNYIEAKASEAGVDTSDRSLENVRNMFEAATKELTNTGGTQSRRWDQCKWTTMVQTIRKKVKEQGVTA
jgi:hypothetical protein